MVEDKQNGFLKVEKQNTEKNQIIETQEKTLYKCVKRVLDVVGSVVALVILFVPLVIIAMVIILDSPGASPIYTQTRVGKNGREFKFYKFRSMVPNAESMLEELLPDNEMEGPAFKIKEDPRITKFGKIIRKCSVDELPQLINVIKGDMSLVGPRPPLPREVEQYNEYQRQRLAVTPGMTCYWQIQPSRNDLSFEEWLEWDIRYIRDRSIKTDIKILFKTIGAVLGLEGM